MSHWADYRVDGQRTCSTSRCGACEAMAVGCKPTNFCVCALAHCSAQTWNSAIIVGTSKQVTMVIVIHTEVSQHQSTLFIEVERSRAARVDFSSAVNGQCLWSKA